MSLKHQLAQLQRERTHELRRASLHYAELKDELAGYKAQFADTMNPARLIADHPAATLSAAFAVGLFLAPAPRYYRTRSRRLPKAVARLARLLPKKYRHYIQTPSEEETEEESPPIHRGLLASLLVDALPALATAVNWPAVSRAFVQGFRTADGSPESSEATVAVADAGTQPADQPLPISTPPTNGHTQPAP